MAFGVPRGGRPAGGDAAVVDDRRRRGSCCRAAGCPPWRPSGCRSGPASSRCWRRARPTPDEAAHQVGPAGPGRPQARRDPGAGASARRRRSRIFTRSLDDITARLPEVVDHRPRPAARPAGARRRGAGPARRRPAGGVPGRRLPRPMSSVGHRGALVEASPAPGVLLRPAARGRSRPARCPAASSGSGDGEVLPAEPITVPRARRRRPWRRSASGSPARWPTATRAWWSRTSTRRTPPGAATRPGSRSSRGTPSTWW